MKTWTIVFCAMAALLLPAAVVMAQHEAHQAAPPPGADAAATAACAESVRQVTALVDSATARVEAARQTNQPSAMRSAIEDLQTTLATIKTQIAACAPASPAAAVTPPAAAAPAAAAVPRMPMVMTSTDPARLKCASTVDPATAPRTTHKGKTYYFCSDEDRREFLADPDMSLSMRPPL